VNVTVVRLRPSAQSHLELIPNINVTGRALPAVASRPDPKAPALTDQERPRRLGDRELYAVEVAVSNDELAAFPGMRLEVDFAPQLFRLLDQSLGVKGSAALHLAAEKARNTKHTDGVVLYLEAVTYPGAPGTVNVRPGVAFRFLDAAGKVLLARSTFNGADLRTAELILVGDDAQPERLFICNVHDAENGPSIADVTAAAQRAGVPLTVVGRDVCADDSWLQDQFQIAATSTREGTQQVLVHLPRVKHDAALNPAAPNLRSFVDGHFPSDEIGVLKDFWATKLALSDGMVSHEFTVAQSYVVYKQLVRIVRLMQVMLQLLRKIAGAPKPPDLPGGDPKDIYRVRLHINAVAELLRVQTRATEQQRQQIVAIGTAVSELSDVVGHDGASVSLTVGTAHGTKRFAFTPANAPALKAFAERLDALHSSGNYGGNIEVSPPSAGDPDGRILTGTIPSAEVNAFLAARAPRQRTAAAYTDWLAVGHIDEIVSFVNAAGRPRILRAAPEAAMRILGRLVELQRSGVAVTRAFRGKQWIHAGIAGGVDGFVPPSAYRWLATPRDPRYPNDPHGPYDITALLAPDLSKAKDYGGSAFHDDRRFLLLSRRATIDARYAAAMTCSDVLMACSLANHAVEALMLSDGYRYANELQWNDYYLDKTYREQVLPRRLDQVLGESFPGWPRLPLPTLFDKNDTFLDGGRTQALMPAVVNLQVLGRHVLVPRPYGPRLPVADAVRFIAELEPRDGGLAGDMPNERWIRDRGLDRTRHWSRAGRHVFQAAVGTRPTQFDVEYDEMSRSIMTAVTVSTTTWDPPSLWEIRHSRDPARNHPVPVAETLYEIAGYFRDGFPAFKNHPVDYCHGDTADNHPRQDRYERDIKEVMDRIDRANPGAFDHEGAVVSKDWKAIVVPEDTVDVFELQAQALLESLGLQVHWVDSWYYHVHGGGIHCGTNVLRSR
jgi:hypothetical protein